MVKVVNCLFEFAEVAYARSFTKSNIADKLPEAVARKFTDGMCVCIDKVNVRMYRW